MYNPSLASGRELRLRWRLVTDSVMGGISRGEMTVDEVDGEACVRLRGHVSTANNGGFVQLSADLSTLGSGAYDRYTGLLLRVRGNGEIYNAHLKTSELRFPWQSYRKSFTAPGRWSQVPLPFADFVPHRTEVPINLRALSKLGIVAIGREFTAELCVANVHLYRANVSRPDVC